MGKKKSKVTGETLLKEIDSSLQSRFGTTWGNVEYIERWIDDYFEKRAERFMREVVGLEANFGEVEIRYNSPMREVFKSVAMEKGKAMAATILQEGLPKLTKTEKKSLRKEFKRSYLNFIESVLRKEGRSFAEALVKKHLLVEKFDPEAFQEALDDLARRIQAMLDMAAAAEKS